MHLRPCLRREGIFIETHLLWRSRREGILIVTHATALTFETGRDHYRNTPALKLDTGRDLYGNTPALTLETGRDLYRNTPALILETGMELYRNTPALTLDMGRYLYRNTPAVTLNTGRDLYGNTPAVTLHTGRDLYRNTPALTFGTVRDSYRNTPADRNTPAITFELVRDLYRNTPALTLEPRLLQLHSKDCLNWVSFDDKQRAPRTYSILKNVCICNQLNSEERIKIGGGGVNQQKYFCMAIKLNNVLKIFMHITLKLWYYIFRIRIIHFLFSYFKNLSYNIFFFSYHYHSCLVVNVCNNLWNWAVLLFLLWRQIMWKERQTAVKNILN